MFSVYEPVLEKGEVREWVARHMGAYVQQLESVLLKSVNYKVIYLFIHLFSGLVPSTNLPTQFGMQYCKEEPHSFDNFLM